MWRTVVWPCICRDGFGFAKLGDQNLKVPIIQHPPPKGLIQFDIIDLLQGGIRHLFAIYPGDLDHAPVGGNILPAFPEANILEQAQYGQNEQKIGQRNQRMRQPDPPNSL